MPSGQLGLNELLCLFNTLPVDLTFVDSEDRVKYFSEGPERIFARPRSVVGRKVQNCHPPQSLDVVEKILTSFKDGTRDSYEFWLQMGGKFIHIRYFAVRDAKQALPGLPGGEPGPHPPAGARGPEEAARRGRVTRGQAMKEHRPRRDHL